MPQRQSFTQVSTPNFVADHGSVRRYPGGLQIDWDNVPASFQDANNGNKKTIRAGWPMDKITATGLLIPRPAGANVAGQATVGLLASDAHEDYGVGRSEAMSGYGVLTGTHVYENLLPVALDANAKAALEGLAGGGFSFQTYSDNRAS